MNNIIFGFHSIEAVLQSKPSSLMEIYFCKNDRRTQKLVDFANKCNVRCSEVSRDFLLKITGSSKNQDIAAKVSESKILNSNDLDLFLGELESLKKDPFFLILDEVKDPHNLGACIRSANAAGVDGVIIPTHNSAGFTATVNKVSSGACNFTNLFQVTNLANALKKLKKMGIWLYGASLNADKIIYNFELKGPIGIILGSEEYGMRKLTQETCDFLFKIPMFGNVESLNVSVAAGVCLFEALRQRKF